jgi:hypothetical protein
MRKRDQAVARIYDIIEEVEQRLEEVRRLLHQVIDVEESEEEIIVDAEVVEEQKPKAKTKKQLREEAKERAREWARAEESK